ncbi:MAG: DUF5658 family protein [Ignisphaera sp.]
MVSTETLYVFTLLNIVDIMTTVEGLRRGAYEANPVARKMLEKFGVAGLFILKYLGMGLIILVGATTNTLETSIWIINIMLSIVAAWNSATILKLKQKSR